MSRLLRLYPARWRARYEAELQGILADRPLSLRDRADLVRGAIDAHLHPDLVVDPSAVLVGAGSGALATTGSLPSITAFATALAVAAFSLGGVLVLQAGGVLWGGRPLQHALLAIGGIALGLLLRRAGGTDPFARIGTTILLLSAAALFVPVLWEARLSLPATRRGWAFIAALTGATLVLGAVATIGGRGRLRRSIAQRPWRIARAVEVILVGGVVVWLLVRSGAPNGMDALRFADSLPAVTTVGVGGAIAGLGATLSGRPDRISGIALIGLAIALVAGHEAGSIRIVAAAMLGLALVSGWLGRRPWRRTDLAPGIDRRRMAAILAGGALLVSAGAGLVIATSGWVQHDGYPLLCEVERDACVMAAERHAGMVRARPDGTVVDMVRVARDGGVEICWTDEVIGRQCWRRSGTEALRPGRP